MSDQHPGKPTLLQEIASVLAAFFGVQSARNRRRDFSTGSARRFIVLGVTFTLLFVLAVIGVVKLIVRQAGLQHDVLLPTLSAFS